MDRRLGLIAFGLSLVALFAVGWFLGRSANWRADSDRTQPRVGRAASEQDGNRPTLEEPATDRLSLDRRSAENQGARPVEQIPRTVVIGRTVDADGRPLSGVEVSLYASEVWCRGIEVPSLPGSPNTDGWKRLSDRDGAFRFDVPTPRALQTNLTLSPGALHAARQFKFDGRGADKRALLAEGTRDLGAIVLAEAGSITGVVVDDQGRPVDNVRVFDISRPGGMGETVTDNDGAFHFDHLLAGNYKLAFANHAFLVAQAGQLDVVLGAVLDAGEIVLERKPTITGHVEDPNGNRLVDVHVIGSPPGSTTGSLIGSTTGRTAGNAAEADLVTVTRTCADGSFVLHVQPGQKYKCQALLDGKGPRGTTKGVEWRAAGSTDVVLVLTPDTQTTFLVRDARTQRPIQNFGLQILRRADRDPGQVHVTGLNVPTQRHADGSFTTGARPGIDEYHLYAPLYEERYGSVVHSANSKTQTIELQPGPNVAGRLLSKGEPVAGVTAQLTLNSEDWALRESYLLEYTEFPVRSVTTDVDGYFNFRRLQPETQHYLLIDGGELGVIVRPVNVAKVTLDLGDMKFGKWARIEGQVQVPFGMDPEGIAIYSHNDTAGKPTQSDSSGKFVFERVRPGPTTLGFEPMHSDHRLHRPDSFWAQHGRTTHPVLAMPEQGQTLVQIRLRTSQGLPSAPWSVRFERPPSLPPAPYLVREVILGTIGTDGTAERQLLPIGPARLVLYSPSRARLIPEHDWVNLLPGVSINLDLRLEFGTLELVFPPSIVWPQKGSLSIVIGDQSFAVSVMDGKLAPSAPLSMSATEHLIIPNLSTGHATVRCTLRKTDMAALAQALAASNKGASPPPSALYENGVDVELTADETTVGTLP